MASWRVRLGKAISVERYAWFEGSKGTKQKAAND
jgi:hypothetical protein